MNKDKMNMCNEHLSQIRTFENYTSIFELIFRGSFTEKHNVPMTSLQSGLYEYFVNKTLPQNVIVFPTRGIACFCVIIWLKVCKQQSTVSFSMECQVIWYDTF